MAGMNETVQVTIPSGGLGAIITIPPARLKSIAGYIVAMTIYAPTLAETASFWISPDSLDALVDFGSDGYQDTDVTIPSAGFVTFSPPPCKTMAIFLDGAAGADRTFKVTFQFDMAT